MDENQKMIQVRELLRDRWGSGRPLMYDGKERYVAREGGSGQYRIETPAVYKNPLGERGTYTLGETAWLIAENDNDMSDWEVSKERLLLENKMKA